MTPLSNQRHEAFARAVSRGQPASRAYSSVYHATGNGAEVNASRLLRNTKVIARVAELKGQAAKRTEKTVASLVDDLDEAIVFARQCKSPSAVVAAIMAQARLLGLEAAQKLEVTHRPAPLPTNVLELTEEEWTAQFCSGPGPRPALSDQGKVNAAAKRLGNRRQPDPAPSRPASNVTAIDHHSNQGILSGPHVDRPAEPERRPVAGAIYLE